MSDWERNSFQFSRPRKTIILILKLWDDYMARAQEIKNRAGMTDLGFCEAIYRFKSEVRSRRMLLSRGHGSHEL